MRSERQGRRHGRSTGAGRRGWPASAIRSRRPLRRGARPRPRGTRPSASRRRAALRVARPRPPDRCGGGRGRAAPSLIETAFGDRCRRAAGRTCVAASEGGSPSGRTSFHSPQSAVSATGHDPARQEQVGGAGDADETGEHPAHAVLGGQTELGCGGGRASPGRRRTAGRRTARAPVRCPAHAPLTAAMIGKSGSRTSRRSRRRTRARRSMPGGRARRAGPCRTRHVRRAARGRRCRRRRRTPEACR